MFSVFLIAVALATEPDCDSLTSIEFNEQAAASLQAIQAADIEQHQAIVMALESRLSCLEFVPSSERWADLLVGIAIVEYAQQGDWQAPLTTALHIHPGVDRLVGPLHEMYGWTPPPPPPPTDAAIPAGVRIYMDGELLTLVPKTPGMHLVQRRTGEGWSSKLLRDGEIPESWFEEPSLVAKRGIDHRWAAGVMGGVGTLGQTADPSGDYVGDAAQSALTAGIALSGSVGLAAGPGLYGDALLAPGRLGVHGGLGWVLGPVEITAGGGIQQVGAIAGDERTSGVVPFPTLGAALGVGSLDVGTHVGLSPAIQRVSGHAAWVMPSGLSVGLASWATSAPWTQPGFERKLTATEVNVVAQVGWTSGTR